MLHTRVLKSSLFIVLALFLAHGLNSCKEVKKEKFIGLQLWSVKDDMKKDTKATIEKVGQIGYKFVEAAGYSDGKFYGMDPVEFKDLCEANGLAFLGSHTGHDLPDSTNWDETMAWWDTCIDAHVAAGVKWIVQPWMGKVGYESLEGLKKYCDYFDAVGKKCNEKGIRFGYHNHAKEFTQLGDVTIYDFMLENTDPEKVMFELDLYWIIEGGKNPVDYFNKYPGRFELWHVKDVAELGASGTIDFEPIFAAAKKAGLKYAIVEVEKYNFEPLVSCEKSLEYLNNADFVKL
ncbi:Sugar or sugar phosphate isomerase/epimerase/dehydrotase [hydrothermal vent metagenome]|uniref:Sugar or sugar phosphate isomerase/epimerase/dehydrotase n=1 Tax=hydrothermal vent metagenome TaxID=652676 RepID=A0A3B0UKU1_9ZZZZ